MSTNNNKANYDASNLSVLKGLEAVRNTPGMYINSTDKVGLHHLVWEIFDNSMDEAMAGHCSKIEVVMNPEGMPENSLLVKDNGRGMPVDIHPEEKISGVELIMTKLHGGGKFGDDNYAMSGGLHGVGAAVTNALSKLLTVRVCREGTKYEQSFSCGIPSGDLSVLGKTDEPNGTEVSFSPDEVMFEHADEECGMEFDFDWIAARLKTASYLNKGLRLTLCDKKTGKSLEFFSENGISDIVTEGINSSEKLINAVPIYFSEKSRVKMKNNYSLAIEMEFAFTAEKEWSGYKLSSFANNIHTKDGGTHITGMRQALVNVVNDYVKAEMDYSDKLEIDDILEGTNIAISLRLSKVQFGGQTKQTLTSSEARPFVYATLKDQLTPYFEENPEFAVDFCKKCILSKTARDKIEKLKIEVRRDTGMNAVGGLASKLSDCQSKDMEICEIFLVEGDSAGGSAKQGRDRKYQAILPLRGKVLNTGKAENGKIYKSKEIMILRRALGTDMGDEFDIAKLRYGKIILLMDADVDGSHIALLLLTLFSKKMLPLIKAGRIYIACPPLYVAKNKRSKKASYDYYQDQGAIDAAYPEGIPDHIEVSRFKGLGEMNPDQLWDTTMNPQTRRLQKVSLPDETAEENLQMLDDLMGEDVAPRKRFLEENAHYAQTL
jgi:DNA gyrase subunit B